MRVAVGATEEAIQLQFLGVHHAESGGRRCGRAFGIVGSYLVSQTLHWRKWEIVESILVAAMFSIAVGVFSDITRLARRRCSIRLKRAVQSEPKWPSRSGQRMKARVDHLVAVVVAVGRLSHSP